MESFFTVHSSSLREGQTVPHDYVYHGMGCHGKNISPDLEWEGAPAETRSFAVTVFDPDAPTGHGWWHWAVVNIPKDVYALEEGASNYHKLPAGALELMTDFHESSYGGPCPPKGDRPHRYVFTVYALKKEKLELKKNTTAEELKELLQENAITSANFTVKYGR